MMIGNLRPASDAEIKHLLEHPEEITRFLYGSDANAREKVGLDRAWHAIHYLLTGSRLGGEEPLNFLASEGTPVGEVDVGYGPARVLTSQQVRAIAASLEPIGPEQLAQRIDVHRLEEADIYPGTWQRDGIGAEWIVDHYRGLRELVTRLAHDGLGMVLYIN